PAQRFLRVAEVQHLELGAGVLEDVPQHRAGRSLVVDDDDVHVLPAPSAIGPGMAHGCHRYSGHARPVPAPAPRSGAPTSESTTEPAEIGHLLPFLVTRAPCRWGACRGTAARPGSTTSR